MPERKHSRVRHVPLDADQRQQIVDLYRQGKKTAEITEATGAARSTIYFVLREEGITPQRRGKSSGVPRGVELPPSEHQRLLDWALAEAIRLREQLAIANEKLNTIEKILQN